MKLSKNLKNVLIFVVVTMCLYMLYKGYENFSNSPRYMYQYVPNTKNASHDIRGDALKIDTMPNAFYESPYTDTHTNQFLSKE